MEESPNRIAAQVLLDTAKVIEERGKSYGPVTTSWEKIARGWTDIIDWDLGHITPTQVALMMVWLKVVRETASHKEDNLVDIMGYAALGIEVDRAD